ncbi:MAG TPA: family 10 glycosylhydrolase, partial [Pirellulales bacterium]|nr:family 10 glycosylhydrolase [Pirellulales bacterium]
PSTLSALPHAALALGAAALIALAPAFLPLAARAQSGPSLIADSLSVEPPAPQTLATEPTMTVRVCWGGGAERQWRGKISISSGSISIVRPLGIIADSPGSIWSPSDKQIEIRERSPRSYDGVDIAIAAPLDARLSISLAADADPRPNASDVALSELVAKMHRRQLDGDGNQLLVRRSPGDSIRITNDGESLIFAPGDVWKLALKPRLVPVSAGTTVYLKARLVAARGGTEFWSQELTAKATENETEPSSLPLEVKLPDAEGVYDLVIEASERGPLRWPKPILERRVQVIVLSPNAAPMSVISGTAGARGNDRSLLGTGDPQIWTQLIEIDPTNPHWYDRLKSLRLSMLITVPLGKESSPGWQGPLGSGNSQIVQHPLGKVVQLAPAARSGDASWEAYPLAIAKPGTPHILEVEYPSDVPQTLGISIIEPNAAGSVAPIGLDSGFDVSEPADGAAPRWLKHRLVFWPRTSSPFVLLANRRDGSRAVYGKLRLYSSGQRLRRAFPAEDHPERLLAGYLDRPLFAANFGGGEALDTFTGRSLTDWQTFHEGATRLADYLNATGRNALMMAVLAEGSTIYPSKLLEPTPRFDSGAFLDLGQDPVRKDVLEMMLRVFDREQLKLIPMLQFSTPLPELETLLREGGPSAVGLQWVGGDGAAWTDVTESRHDMAPYYNLLDPRVQQAMLRVIHELVDRCAMHTAFAGLAIELSADGFAQLPGEAWGLDDRTIARFEREAGLSVPGVGQNRFAERARFVTGPGRRAWLIWRSSAVADFYRRVEQELLATRRDTRLYLAPTKPFDLPEIERELRPSLPPHGRIDEALLAVGIRPDAYRNDPGIVLLRSQRLSPAGRLAAQAIDIETNRSSEWDAAILAQPSPAALFYHEPQRCRLASFDAKSPFGKDKTYTWLISQIVPSQQGNRRRFVHSLATLDSEAMFDGGWLLPLAQEPALDNVTAAYRQLPARRFETLADSIEPLTVRTLHADGSTYAYLVNDSPWPMRASLQVAAPL